ncbi:MAG: HEAT repeat domain-containing protein [Pyrinomonadaceae bacterium]|nr:HEAT repeat domain-containing protein [Pyrinomonadaceae bacterium]
MRNSSLFRRVAVVAILFVFSIPSFAFVRPLSKAPINLFADTGKLPPVNWIRSRKYDIKHLSIDLRFDWDKEQAMGEETVSFAPFNDSNQLTLDAAYMTINWVKAADGSPLKFDYAGKDGNDNLVITLNKTLKAGEISSVKISYATHYVNEADANSPIGGFGKGLRFIKPGPDDPNKPRQIWSQGETEFNRYWFPSYDTPNDFRTTELRATVAKPFFVVSNGKLESTTENKDGTRTFYWKMDQPYANYLTSIVVAETTPVVQNFEGTPVYNYGYTNETKEVAATTKNLPATIKFFSDITGVRYPYPKYSQAFVEDFGGGMENISATTQIEEMIHDDRELLDEDSESLQSHELAHQWFGDYVTCRDWGQIWLNESFATYMQSMWDEKFKGHDEFLYSDVRANQNTVLGDWERGHRRPIVTKYYANKDAMFDNYAYPGGGSVLHMLRKTVGDAGFFRALNNYLKTNAHQPVSTEDLRIAFEESTGQSLDWFFDEWLYKMGHPVFDITKSYDAATKKLTLNVKQTQEPDEKNPFPQTRYFQTWVEVEIDGTIHRVWIDPKETNTFTFDSATEPKIVNFDYEGTLLKEMTFKKSADELLYQMANDKDVLGRRWAIGELDDLAKTDPAVKAKFVDALIVSAEKDPFWRIRKAALVFIADVYSPEPMPGQKRPAAKLDPKVEALVLRLTKDKESLIRADAIKLLGETQDTKFLPQYLAALNDRSYGVIDQAAPALGATKDAKAYDALLKLVNAKSWHDRLLVAGLRGLEALGDKRGFDAAIAIANDNSRSSIVRATAATTAAATANGDPRAFDLLLTQFKAALAANDIQGLVVAAQGAIKLGDPRGQQIFDALKEKFKDNAQAMPVITQWEAAFKANIKK